MITAPFLIIRFIRLKNKEFILELFIFFII